MQAHPGYTRSGSLTDPLILVAEISHRVVNEYSQAVAGIRLAAEKVASTEARSILVSAAACLVSFAEAHRALQPPAPCESIDLEEYLETLCASISAAVLEERGVRLTLTTDTATVSAERAWRVALIISELITNCVRHGLKNGPGEIDVQLGASGPDVACRVTDNGCGSRLAKPGRGFAVVTGLADELGGSLAWSFTPKGTTAELIFPLVIEDQQS